MDPKRIALVRQRRQKGIAKFKAQKNYRKSRGTAKIKARKRYRFVKNKPGFKRKQKIRKKKPWLFRRIKAVKEVSSGNIHIPHDITFIHPDTEEVSVVRDLSQITGDVMYMTENLGYGTLPLESFLEEIVFLSYEDIENFYEVFDHLYLTDDEEDAFDKSDAVAEESEEKIATMVESLVGKY